MRLYSISGMEFLDYDNFQAMKDNEFLFFSNSNYKWFQSIFIGEEFDYSVCMEFLEIKRKLG
jgi:hypothetical protein